MTTWRLQLRPQGAWATPLRADSLFGAICWRWLELFPESFDAMIAAFDAREPPFILSDAFPDDLLPLPLHLRPSQADTPVVGRKLQPPVYISEPSFQRVAQGISPSASEVIDRAVVSGAQVRTAIDREFGTAADSQLYQIGTQSLRQEFTRLSVYIRSARYQKEVTACFKAIALTGFGKKSSTGLGGFEVMSEPQRCEWMDQLPSANAFMSLSHFVPVAGDPTVGRWRLQVTYPKFHANAVANVFKGSILMMTPGSVFHSGEMVKSWYGSIIPMPRPEMPKAIHYALAFAVPVRWGDA